MEYLISTQPELLDIDFIYEAFGSEDMYWAKTIPKEHITAMIALSTTLGLYKVLPGGQPAKTEDSPSSQRIPSPTIDDHHDEKLEQVGMVSAVR